MRSQSSVAVLTFPASATVAAAGFRLPTAPTSLIGREGDIAAVSDQFVGSDTRLLTLFGPGGIGKTRLALAVGHNLAGGLAEDSVAWVDLAAIDDADLVASSIQQALGIPPVPRRAPVARLCEALRDTRLLLILDNFEHVRDAAVHLGVLLSACPGLRLLVTSRAVLHVAGEHVYDVAPLACPAPAQRHDLHAVARAPAVALFVERAAAVSADFQLTDAMAPTVAELCAHLDGLPLAIELAAARTRLLTPSAILARLDQRLGLLTTGAVDAPRRHQTLRAAIDWSFDLLTESQRRLLRRLAVFAGGWTLAALEAVSGSSADEHGGQLLGDLAALVDNSLVWRRQSSDAEPRFGMSETVRAFALEQLAATAEQALIRQRHAEHFLALAEAAQQHGRGPSQGQWLDRLDTELDNLRAALTFAGTAEPRTDLELRLASALWQFCELRGHLAEGRRWLDNALARNSGGAPGVRAQALKGAGNLARTSGACVEARRLYTVALELYRSIGDQRGQALVLSNLANVAYDQGELDVAREMCEHSRALREALGDQPGVVMMLGKLGTIARGLGQTTTARQLHDLRLQLARAAGDAWGVAQSLDDLGIVMLDDGDPAAAERLHADSLNQFGRLGDTAGMAHALLGLGRAALARGDSEHASAWLADSASRFRDLGTTYAVASVLGALGQVALTQGRADRSARLLGASASLREATGCRLPPVDQAEFDRALQAVRARLGETSTAAAMDETRAWGVEQAVSFALEVAPLAAEVAPPAAEVAAAHARPGGLSSRECQVVAHVARGASNRQIADALVLSERTVESHVSSALNKLGFSSRTRLATWAVQHGLLDPAA